MTGGSDTNPYGYRSGGGSSYPGAGGGGVGNQGGAPFPNSPVDVTGSMSLAPPPIASPPAGTQTVSTPSAYVQPTATVTVGGVTQTLPGVLGSNSLQAQIANEETDLANNRALLANTSGEYYTPANVAAYTAAINAQVAQLQSQGVQNP